MNYVTERITFGVGGYSRRKERSFAIEATKVICYTNDAEERTNVG